MRAGPGDGTPAPPLHACLVEDAQDVDDALELAIERTIAAQYTFEATPLSAPDVVPAADTVVHRAEDVHVLADEADEALTHAGPGSGGASEAAS